MLPEQDLQHPSNSDSSLGTLGAMASALALGLGTIRSPASAWGHVGTRTVKKLIEELRHTPLKKFIEHVDRAPRDVFVDVADPLLESTPRSLKGSRSFKPKGADVSTLPGGEMEDTYPLNALAIYRSPDRIYLHPEIFTDSRQAAQTGAHELTHFNLDRLGKAGYGYGKALDRLKRDDPKDPSSRFAKIPAIGNLMAVHEALLRRDPRRWEDIDRFARSSPGMIGESIPELVALRATAKLPGDPREKLISSAINAGQSVNRSMADTAARELSLPEPSRMGMEPPKLGLAENELRAVWERILEDFMARPGYFSKQPGDTRYRGFYDEPIFKKMKQPGYYENLHKSMRPR